MAASETRSLSASRSVSLTASSISPQIAWTSPGSPVGPLGLLQPRPRTLRVSLRGTRRLTPDARRLSFRGRYPRMNRVLRRAAVLRKELHLLAPSAQHV